MNAISLSKTHSRHAVDSSGSHSSKNTSKDALTNHLKWSNVCKRLNEEVSSFQHLVLLTAAITLMCVAVGGITLGDHIILATLGWGRYEW